MKISLAGAKISPLRVFSFIIGLLVLFFLLRKIDFGTLLSLILSIKVQILILAGAAYLVKAIFRALRFLRLNQQDGTRFYRMLRLTLASSLASQVLPFKLGELTYIYLVKKEYKAALSQGVSSLMVVRIFDLLAIPLWFMIAAAIFGLPGVFSVYLGYIIGFSAALVAVLVALVVIAKYFPSLPQILLRPAIFQRFNWMTAIQKEIAQIIQNLAGYTGRLYLEMTGLSLAEWLANFGMYHLMLQGMGLNPRLIDTVAAVTFAALASVLPINSFGNFGTQEAGWATALVFSGYTQEIALTSGFATHLLSLGYMLLLGGAAWITYLLETIRFRRAAADFVEKQ